MSQKAAEKEQSDRAGRCKEESTYPTRHGPEIIRCIFQEGHAGQHIANEKRRTKAWG